MRFAGEGEEHMYLAANEFTQELKKAPEWMLTIDADSARLLVLRTRDKPMGQWSLYYSPDPLKMTAEEWLDFNQTVELIAELRRQDRLHDQPEQSNH
jgi:hypothetical protein